MWNVKVINFIIKISYLFSPNKGEVSEEQDHMSENEKKESDQSKLFDSVGGFYAFRQDSQGENYQNLCIFFSFLRSIEEMRGLQ